MAVVLLTPALVLADPPATSKQIRVKMSLEVTGTYQAAGTAPKTNGMLVKGAFDNRYNVEYVIPADTILVGAQKTNPLDPNSQKEMDDYSAKVKAREDGIYHSADNLRGRGPGAPGGGRPTNPMANVMPEMMQKIMACGQDQACKQKLAMEMMSQQVPSSAEGAKVQADIQAIGDMRIKDRGQNIGSKGYEDCMNAEGNRRSTVKRSATDDEPEIAEIPDLISYTGLTATARSKATRRLTNC
jgi:hypothetical protein